MVENRRPFGGSPAIRPGGVNATPGLSVGNVSESGESHVIWGTNIDVPQLKAKIADFFTNFCLPGEADAYYMKVLNDMFQSEQYEILNVDCGHMNEFDEDLYSKLIK